MSDKHPLVRAFDDAFMSAPTRESQFEIALFVNCAKCWLQQSADGSKQWAAQAVIHPFLQTEPAFGKSPGAALNAAYSDWKQRNP